MQLPFPYICWLAGILIWLFIPVQVVEAQVPDSNFVDAHVWTPAEKKLLASLSLENLSPPPPDPSNAVADNKVAAVFGRRLFFDARLSANGMVSCATCHQPSNYFTDGLTLARGVGVTQRHTMTIVGAAYSHWYFWDGRKDSQWSQALGPLESAVEHGSNRNQIAHLLHDDELYRRSYEELFGPFPDISDPARFPESAGPVDAGELSNRWDQMSGEDQQIINRIFSNTGKVIAAYERLILPEKTRFDDYIKLVLAGDHSGMKDVLTDAEARGLRLFIGNAQCVNCHNGPLLTNYSFHNTGVPQGAEGDAGRLAGVSRVKEDPFNCLGIYSDARPEQCLHLRFVRSAGIGLYMAFKTPTLRNITETAPYMHAGQFNTLADVLDHYNDARLTGGHTSELVPLKLKESQLKDLEAFLHTLTGARSAGTEAD